MIVLVNAISIGEGGSLVVLENLLEQLCKSSPGVQWHVAIRDEAIAAPFFAMPNVKPWIFPWVTTSPALVQFWYEWTLPRLIRDIGADCLFSQTNYLSRRRLPLKTLLLVQNAGHFSREFERLTLLHAPGPLARWIWKAKTRWVMRSIAKATMVTVQTEALKRQIVAQTATAEERIAVIPHGCGQVSRGRPRAYPDRGPWRVGYLTHFGVQKNFGVLFRAGRVLAEKGIAVELVITIDPHIPEYSAVTREICESGIDPGAVRNLGRVPASQVPETYESLHISVFPSLCESFGFPLMEGMACGLPTLAADIDSNREVATGGAAFFAALDHEDLAAKLEELIRDRRRYEAASRRSLERAAEFSWEAAAAGTLQCLEQVAGLRRAAIRSTAGGQAGFSIEAKTRKHYDRHPLDFLHAEDLEEISDYQPRFFRDFVAQHLASGMRVADVGCGPGRATKFLAEKGMDVYGLDISTESMRLAKARAPAAHYVCASNMKLPIRDASFDAVISDGVIHHTAAAEVSFRENARLVAPGGYLYLGIYRRYGYYYYLYTYFGTVLRWLAQWRWGQLLVTALFLPPYYAIHLLKSSGKRTWAGARNFFFDYFLTPRATFHTREQVLGWAREAGLSLLAYEPHIGNVHAFVFRKSPLK
jgi:glycosyltransferase involved in cell wall biosynthesis/SAM-dependent methyltransferase